MPLHPEIAPHYAPLYGATMQDLQSGRVSMPVVPPEPVDGVRVEDRTVPAAHGEVKVRVYTPGSPPIAALVWNHGGGWMGGDLNMPEAHQVALRVARDLPAVVVSVGYRLAPAHTHPAAVDDIVAAFDWTVTETGARPALGGASAGGHLSACAAIALRDRGTSPSALLLAYPATDPVAGPYPDVRPEECPAMLWLDAPIVSGLFRQYAADGAAGSQPARDDLRGLPPTLVTTAQYDALQPQAVRFVEQLRDVGVDAEHHDEPGLLHGYLNHAGSFRVVDDALARYTDWLRAVLTGARSGAVARGS